MGLKKYILIFAVILFGFVAVQANKTRNFQYKAPANFLLESNYFPAFHPMTYTHTGAEKITVLVPPEIRSTAGVPKTKTGELDKKFIQGKLNFNQQFGIQEWMISNYNFSQTPHGERLEIKGSYLSFAGVKTEFIEHHYFSKTIMQSIHLFYPSSATGKAVEQAKASLQTFNPNIN